MAAKAKKAAPRASPQIKVTIPKGHWPDVEAAMEYDGATKVSQFALAAIMQRVRRIQRMQAQDSKDDKP